MTATCFATASRPGAEAGLPGRVAQPFEGDAVAKHHRHAVRQQAAAGTLHQGKSIASGDMLGGSPYHRVTPHQLPEPVLRLRLHGRRTSHPVAAHRGWHQNSSCSRSGSEGRTNLYRGILQPGRYAVRPPRSDQGSASLVNGYVLRESRVAVTSLSTPRPLALPHASHSARERSATCVRARQWRSAGSARARCRPVRGTNGLAYW